MTNENVRVISERGAFTDASCAVAGFHLIQGALVFWNKT